MNSAGSILLAGSLQQLGMQIAVWLVKIILALIIWGAGKHLIALAVRFSKKTSLGFKNLPKVVNYLGKFLLILIILDYLGLGRTIVGAVANGLTLAVAIALGIAFGEALKSEAKKIVEGVREEVNK